MKRKGIIKTLAVVFAAIFATLFVFSFGACGEESGGEEADERLTVRIGSDDYSPFFYRDESGDFAGIDVELATEAFKRIGRRAVFTEIDWSEKNLRLENGEIDCLWGCFSMTGREELYAWAGPYMKSRQVLAVRADSDINTFADLKGKSVAMQYTSKADELFSSGEDERIPELSRILCFTNFENIFAALKNGFADAIAGHETALKERMKSNTGKYRILEETLLSVELGVAFKIGGGEELAALISKALVVMRNDGFTASVLKRYGVNPDDVMTGEV